MKTHHALIFTATILAMPVLAVPAYAVDGADFLKKLDAVQTAQSSQTFTYSAIEEGADNTLVVHDFLLAPSPDTANDDSFSQVAPVELVVTGLRENADGSYDADALNLPATEFANRDTHIRFTGLALGNIHVPAVPSSDSFSGLFHADTASMTGIDADYKGKPVLAIDSVDNSQVYDMDSQTVRFSWQAANIALDLNPIDELSPTLRERLQKLDLMTAKANLTSIGTWNLASGELQLESAKADIDNVGEIETSANLMGFSMDTLGQLDELKGLALPSQGGDNAAVQKQAQSLVLMQKFAVSSLSVQFTDASITNRLLEMLSAEQGESKGALTEKLRNTLSGAIGYFNSPPLTAMVNGAADAYLADPKSLEIKIQPPSATPIFSVFLTGLAAPQALPGMLGLSVAANQ
ncbi:hypothetical protein FJU08_18665 [Martelella alba]|uniref:DUF945 domain-containing protein n=1 Tax=Martelella alba TaxID=2590451 RepID=A0A506U410_9HYPH|nr:hypothetical protein [Martelella alba]TPW28066.1 hypothetical protein FJU08_18665 [Martelella alba]